MIKAINVISDTNIGGAGKILLSFLEKYDRERFDVKVVIPKNSQLKERIEALGVPAIEVDGMADDSKGKAAEAELLELFKTEKPDVVHTHASLGARRAAKKYGKCAIVYTRHSVFDQPSWKKSFPFKQINGHVNNSLADRVIAVSPAAKENIVEVGVDPEKIQVIFNGVAPAVKLTGEEKAAVREKWGVGADDFVCAIIARLEEVKGHEYVLKAAKKLMDAGENVKIMIAGNGSIENRLKAMAEDMKLTNVIFTGFIREIHEIENIMDVQLNASYGTEATSLSLLEGMSLGVPAIVSDFGGNPYVIETGVNGIVVPKRDENALCDAILKIKSDRELYDKCSEGAKKVFSEKFTVESMTRQIEDVYTELSAKKGGVN